jgi:hypothetical protein
MYKKIVKKEAGAKDNDINKSNHISNVGKAIIVTLETGKQIQGKFQGYTSDNEEKFMLIDSDMVPLSEIHVTHLA